MLNVDIAEVISMDGASKNWKLKTGAIEGWLEWGGAGSRIG